MADPSPETSVLRSSKHWDVHMPPVKRSMVQGRMLPTFKGAVGFLHTQRRRISIEVHSPIDAVEQDEEKVLGDRDSVRVQIWQEPEGKDDNDDDWIKYSQCELGDVQVLRSWGRVCELAYGAGDDRIIRDVYFSSIKQAKSFRRVLESMSELLLARAHQRVQEYQKEHPLKTVPVEQQNDDVEEGHMIHILVEIVSALDLPIADIFSSDPFCIVYMGGRQIHATDVIPSSLNPIWTIETGSLFLLSMTPEDFFASTNGMAFFIKDYDAFSASDVLGIVNVGVDELLVGTGKRVKYPLQDCENEKARLVLRYKPASPDDIEFMRAFQSSKTKVTGAYAKESFLPPMHHSNFGKKKHKGLKKIERKFLVRPFPDPERDSTKYMTAKEIEDEAFKPSKCWVEAGSGTLGKLYVELIGCDGLPNLDLPVKPHNRTDAFACFVYEDCIVNTDVIDDSLSPRWMPWSQRAFVFNISHPSSQLVVGVFNYNSPNPLDRFIPGEVHQPIGRVLIDLSSGGPGAEYTLKYDLHLYELGEDRKSNGTITMRVRIEWEDQRKALWVGSKPPSSLYAAVPKQIDFDVAHYTTAGKYNPDEFSMESFVAYCEELQSYEEIVAYLKQAAFSVWMWRGHYALHLRVPTVRTSPESADQGFLQRHTKEVTLWLPLHSITAFTWGVLIVRDFNRVPSFLAFSVGWILLATMEHVQKHPSPWTGTKTYWEMLVILFLNRSSSPEQIKANENLAEIEAYDAQIDEKEEQEKADKEREQKHAAKLGGAMKEAEEEEEIDIATKKGSGFSNVVSKVNPTTWLKPVLFPIQVKLGQVVIALRVSRSIILWQENYYAFWVVTASFLICALFFWVPWEFLIRWSLKIFVWAVLGPWMKLVDIFYFRKREKMTEEEKEAEVKARLQSRFSQVVERTTNRQIKKERAYKLQAMKKSMFGSYLLRVPRFREARYPDIPLPSSSAEPYDESLRDHIIIVDRKFGQHLEGDMIPKRYVQVQQQKEAEEASKSGGTLNPEMETLLVKPFKGAVTGAAAGTYGAVKGAAEGTYRAAKQAAEGISYPPRPTGGVFPNV